MKWPAITGLLIVGVTVANGYWGTHSSQEDPRFANLGFYVFDMDCNEARTYCQKCYTGRSERNISHLNVFEVTTDPARYRFSVLEGNQNWAISIVQADLAQPYRMCVAWDNYTMDAQFARVDVCLDNTFEGVKVPPECPRPVLVVSLGYYAAHRNIRGRQNLLCAA